MNGLLLYNHAFSSHDLELSSPFETVIKYQDYEVGEYSGRYNYLRSDFYLFNYSRSTAFSTMQYNQSSSVILSLFSKILVSTFILSWFLTSN